MDLANAHFEALKFLQSNNPQILNLNVGTGSGSTVLELIKTLKGSITKNPIFIF